MGEKIALPGSLFNPDMSETAQHFHNVFQRRLRMAESGGLRLSSRVSSSFSHLLSGLASLPPETQIEIEMPYPDQTIFKVATTGEVVGKVELLERSDLAGASTMVKEPRLVPGRQDVLTRSVYVVRPRQALLDHIDSLGSGLSRFHKGPVVVMTEEVPAEAELEGWGICIAKKCKEAFIRRSVDEFPLSVMDLPETLLHDMTVLVAFFDKWWTAERSTGHIEIVRGSWKTDTCWGEG